MRKGTRKMRSVLRLLPVFEDELAAERFGLFPVEAIGQVRRDFVNEVTQVLTEGLELAMARSQKSCNHGSSQRGMRALLCEWPFGKQPDDRTSGVNQQAGNSALSSPRAAGYNRGEVRPRPGGIAMLVIDGQPGRPLRHAVAARTAHRRRPRAVRPGPAAPLCGAEREATGKTGRRAASSCFISRGRRATSTCGTPSPTPRRNPRRVQTIATTAPGVQLTEVLPLLAQEAHRFGVDPLARRQPKGLANHGAAIYMLMTGHDPSNFSPTGLGVPPTREDLQPWRRRRPLSPRRARRA